MRRVLCAAVVLGVLALATAPTALADKPVREFLPGTPVMLDAAVCGFPVEISFASNEFITTFSSGKQIVTGRLTAQVTGNGKTITVNASGPGFITTEGALLTGKSILFANPGDLFPGHPGGLLLASGPVTITTDENGQVLVDFTSARTVDLCPVLADP
jgi:hypothetical protein